MQFPNRNFFMSRLEELRNEETTFRRNYLLTAIYKPADGLMSGMLITLFYSSNLSKHSIINTSQNYRFCPIKCAFGTVQIDTQTESAV